MRKTILIVCLSVLLWLISGKAEMILVSLSLADLNLDFELMISGITKTPYPATLFTIVYVKL